MSHYLTYLATRAGLPTGRCDADGWITDYATSDGRDMPTLSILWDGDALVWNGWIGIDKGAEFAHPSDAFSWLRNAVAAYEFPVCDDCDDTGLVRISVDQFDVQYYTVDTTEACGCWHGKKVQP